KSKDNKLKIEGKEVPKTTKKTIKTSKSLKTINQSPIPYDVSAYNKMVLAAYKSSLKETSKDYKTFGVTRDYIKKYVSAYFKIKKDSPELSQAIKDLISNPKGEPRLIAH